VLLDLAEKPALHWRHESDADHQGERYPLPAPFRAQEV
jgi:hypothetical protein